MKKILGALALAALLAISPTVAYKLYAQGTNIAPDTYACMLVDGSCASNTSNIPLPVALSPAATSVAPVVSSSAEASHVLKATPGSLLSLMVTNVGTGGFMMVFNSTTVPGDGPVTPTLCFAVPAGAAALPGTSSVAFGIPDKFTTGISVAYSTTGCFFKTLGGNNIFFSAQVN